MTISAKETFEVVGLILAITFFTNIQPYRLG